MSIFQKSYRFRMCPNQEQTHRLYCLAGARRFIWNWALARRKGYYKKHGKGITYNQLSRELTELKYKEGTEWLQQFPAAMLQQVLRDLDQAFAAFFAKRSGYPKFKSKKENKPRFRIPQGVRITDGKIFAWGLGYEIKIEQSQPVDGKTKSATFKCDACGNWYVTIVTEFEMPDVALPLPDKKKVIGIDAGLKDFIVTSNGEKVPPPKFFRQAERKIARANRKFSKCQKGSKRRDKARKRLAKVYQKTANQRKDFLHKLSTDLVRKHDGICIENLNIKGLVRTKQAKSWADAAHGMFRRFLEYKCLWNRKHFVKIDRFFPSSKNCCYCGFKNEDLTLADRFWFCPCCGLYHDRDWNAAINILEEGWKILVAGHANNKNACGACVRFSTWKATGVESRIPSC